MADTTEKQIEISGIDIRWRPQEGTCTFEGLPVAMMWVDSTLMGVMAGVQSMVGTKRFVLALQREGRESVEADWQVISRFEAFEDGFAAIANFAAVAGWGRWQLVSLDMDAKICRFKVHNSWEGRLQKALGVCWGSGMLAGKMAGYCSRLFGTNCWAEQTAFIARGDASDAFVVKPSQRSLETELEELLSTDEATRADMAVALERLRQEIAEREQIQVALQSAEEQHRAIVEASHDAIFIETIEGNVVDCNSRAAEIYGWTKEELTGMNAAALVDDRTAAIFPEVMEKHERGGTISLEATGKRKDGTLFPTEVNTRVQRIGGKDFVVVFVRDISARRQAEQERRWLEEQLRQSQKMEAIGRLAGGVAHDFNNILTGISGYAELLLLHLGPGDPLSAEVREIQQAAGRAAELTQQLLAFSRKQVMSPKVLRPNDVITHSQKLLARIIGEDVELRFVPGHGLWNIMADPGQLDQILVNLAVNARDAMPKGGRLTIETGNIELHRHKGTLSEEERTGEFVVLAVSDDGCGMAPEILERIFEPFFTTKPKGRASGLGLSTVYGIVRQNNGFVDVSSQEGLGTTFKIYLPRVDAEAQEIVSGAFADLPLGKETILLVEDEEMVRRLAKRALTSQGYVVLEAQGGGDAFLLSERHEGKIDLLLTDVVMPLMNGRELHQRLLVTRPDLPALFMSGYSEDVIAHHGVLEEETHFIQKPFTIEALLRKVRETLKAR